MKKILFFLATIFVFVACTQIHYYNIPDEQKTMMNNLDTIIYNDSLTQQQDTIVYTFYDTYHVSDKVAYDEYRYCYYTLSDIDKSFEYFCVIQADVEIGFDINYFNYRTKIIPSYSPNQILTNYSQNKVVYPSVYVIHDDNIPSTLPNTIYYSFKEGIIRYDYSDGRQYKRLKVLPKK